MPDFRVKKGRKSQPPSHVKYDSNGLNGSLESLDKIAMIPLHDKVDRRGPKAATPSLSLALAKGLMLTAAAFKFGQDVLTFIGPQLLKSVIIQSCFNKNENKKQQIDSRVARLRLRRSSLLQRPSAVSAFASVLPSMLSHGTARQDGNHQRRISKSRERMCSMW